LTGGSSAPPKREPVKSEADEKKEKMKNALFAGISNKKDSDDSDNEAKNEEVKKTEPEPMIDLLNMDDSAGGTNLLSNDPPQ